MHETSAIQARLEAADPSGGSLPDLLEAAWDGFDLLLAACHQCEGRSAELFAAFAFASAAAAQGRLLVWAAPSLPPACVARAGGAVLVADDLDCELAAATLASLAQVLSTRLSLAARHAGDPGDQAAAAAAADQASEVCRLLAGEP